MKSFTDLKEGKDITGTVCIRKQKDGRLLIKVLGYQEKFLVMAEKKDYSKIPEIEIIKGDEIDADSDINNDNPDDNDTGNNNDT